MKKMIALGPLLLLSVLTKSVAQDLKIGYADQSFIYSNLPDYQSLTKETEANSKKYQVVLQEKYATYQKKLQEYQNLNKDTPAALVKDRSAELQSLEKSIRDFEADSQNEIQATFSKKMEPIEKKVAAAIEEVGKLQKFTYIVRLEANPGSGESWPLILYSADNSGDISDAVLKKLGVQTVTNTARKTPGLSYMLKK